jgi:SAM-dependent methyltransferase
VKYREKHYPESRFGGFTDIDGTIAFYLRVNSVIEASSVVLDFGCGRGAFSEDGVEVRKQLRTLRGKAAKVVGLDVDAAAGAGNPFIDEFYPLQGQRWPMESHTVDVCVCDSVIEHLQDPDAFFQECSRVIRPGGYLCIRTPNAWSYVALFSKLIPNKYHSSVLKKVQDKRSEEDVFPTFYRCNSILKLKRALNANGFDAVVYGYEAEPSYLSISGMAYRLGVIHQKVSPKCVRPVLHAFAQLRKSELLNAKR